MAFTGHETIEELRYQLARRLYTAVVLNASILKVKDVLKIPDIEKIVLLLKKRSQWNGVRAFLQIFPCFFLVTDENGTTVIKPIVTIEFCRSFDGKRGCGRTYCAKLHVCRHFVKGKCTFGPRCKKPHHFQSNETREVLKKHFLDELSDEQAREFLCRNVQHLLDPETLNGELPKTLEICKYYNVATGCTREFCPYIHVCRFYAEEGNCKFGSQCIRKHDINNVHSRILLHRYHMDHLNDQQVIAYLKIKGENRDQQQQQQQQPQPNMETPPPLLPSFSLPNGILSNIHAAIVNDIGRKLSQPSPHNGIPLLEDGINTRKLSLPTPPISRSMLYRPPVTLEGNSHRLTTSKATLGSSLPVQNGQMKIASSRHENKMTSNSFGSGLDNRYVSEPLFKRASPPMNRHALSSSSSTHNSFNDSFMQIITSDLTHKLNLSANDNKKTSPGSYEGLGLCNLSPPVTRNPSVGDFVNTSHVNTASTLPPLSSNNTNLVFSTSKSFENFPSNDVDSKNNASTDISHSFQSSCLSFSNSIPEQTHSFFTSRVPFVRASSNDIISPTGSVSSVNGTYVNGTSTNSLNGQEHVVSDDWQENGITKSLAYRDADGDFALSYYRTNSLPNFTTSKSNAKIENFIVKETSCTCKKNEICVYFLKDICRFPTCKKLHNEESFQWQISSQPLTAKHYNNGFNKNENFDRKFNRWINVEKNENLKLESSFCSPEIEESEIDYCNDSIMINFNEMVGIARSEINSTYGSSTQRSCDLSAWLLQANDEASLRRNSQDTVVYSVRRVSTRSAVIEDFDVHYATHWVWYWQDSFGIWRKYPTSKAEVIDTNSTCYSDELEKRFLEGQDQYLFEDAKVLVDYKVMLQVSCLTRKQKKIRRRPRFICKEHRDQLGSIPETVFRMTDVRRPWYWNKESSIGNRPYELVDVSISSDTFATVRNHFTRSMDEKSFEILSMKSVQNIQLWTRFISLRNQFEKSNIKYADKFVFKKMCQEQLSGVCQQGFQICSCKQRNGLTCQENKFSTEATYAINVVSGEKDDIQYMFCVRLTIPLSDVKKIESNVRLGSSPEESDGHVTPTQDALVRHTHQVYPEFLIVFKRT